MMPCPPALSLERKAFTLLEILISVSLLALLATFMFPVIDGASNLWRTNEQRVDSYREARASLQFISRELGSIVLPASSDNLPEMVINSPDVTLPAAAITPSEGGGSLFFLANIATSAQDPAQNQSNLCTVGYYLAYTNDRSPFDPGGNSTGTSKLYRYQRSSQETYNAITNSQSPYSGADPGNALNNEVLARNITSFTVRGLRWDGAVTKYEVIDTWPEPAPPVGTPPPSTPTPGPDLIEISLTALNSNSAARLTTRAQWVSRTGTLYTQEAQTFTLRIHVRL